MRAALDELVAERVRAATLTPDEILDHVVRTLAEPMRLDEDLCLRIGCGELENLIRHHEDEIWLRIVELATHDERFRIALSCVWAFATPHAAERQALLEDLAERERDAPCLSRRSGGRPARGTRR